MDLQPAADPYNVVCTGGRAPLAKENVLFDKHKICNLIPFLSKSTTKQPQQQ